MTRPADPPGSAARGVRQQAPQRDDRTKTEPGLQARSISPWPLFTKEGKKGFALFFHAVYFYPREGAQPTDSADLLAGVKTLQEIPGLTFFEVGTPAGTPREVVDNAYLVALLTAFDDVRGHDAYQDHPIHLAFIERCKHLWSRVVVFDSVSG